MALKDLVFSDLFVAGGVEQCWYKETSSSRDGLPIPPDCALEVMALRRVLVEEKAEDGSKIDWQYGSPHLLRLRVQRMEVADGEHDVFVCSRPNTAIRRMADLRFPAPVTEKLLSADMRDGLVVFMGRTRAGKSTAAAAYVVDYVARHGGVCWTVESPIEMLIQGSHGRGRVYQMQVGSEREYGKIIRRMLRAVPDVMLVGECRDNDAVSEAVLAGTTGHLVVTTFHAASVSSGLERLASMADSAANLANALRAVIHLEVGSSGGVDVTRAAPEAGRIERRRRLTVTPLFVQGESADGIRSMIRAGQFHQLASEIERQRRFLMSEGGS